MSQQHVGRPKHARAIVRDTMKKNDGIAIGVNRLDTPRAQDRAVARRDLHLTQVGMILGNDYSGSLFGLSLQGQAWWMQRALDGEDPGGGAQSGPRDESGTRDDQDAPDPFHIQELRETGYLCSIQDNQARFFRSAAATTPSLCAGDLRTGTDEGSTLSGAPASNRAVMLWQVDVASINVSAAIARRSSER